jgi:uncharacterized protein (TIGR03435 family)
MRPRPGEYGSPISAWLTVLFLIAANAQPLVKGLNDPSFEVVSIKPNGTNHLMAGASVEQGCRRISGGISCNVTLSAMLQMAFSVSAWQVSAPDWVGSDIYQLSATLPAEQDRKLIGPMIRTMLFERFGLAAHREQKQTSVYALVIGKRGPKLREAAHPDVGNSHSEKGIFSATAMHMPTFAGNLTSAAGRPVIDMTGLKGAYEIDLHWTPEYEDRPGIGRKEVGILSVLEEKLGLKLEARKLPFDRIVVDHVDRIPTAN